MTESCSPVVIRFGRLGDTILLQPLLQRLRRRYGGPCRLLALGDWPPVLYAAQPEVGGFIHLRSQYGPLWLRPARWRVMRELARLKASPFYVCEPSLRADTKLRPMLKLAGVPLPHCCFIDDLPMRRDEHWLDWLERFSETTPPAFAADYGAMPCAPIGSPRLRTTAAERRDSDQWLAARDLAGRPLVLLQAANKRTMRWNGVRDPADDDKSWPAIRWLAIARAVAEELPQARVLLCGPPAEAPYLKQAFGTLGAVAPGVEVVVLPLGRLKALLEIAHSVISVDTGPAHLAAAMGCPLVVLFGNRSPLMWAPRSGRGSDVRVVGSLPAIARVDQIDVAQVVDAWRGLSPRAVSCALADGSHVGDSIACSAQHIG